MPLLLPRPSALSVRGQAGDRENAPIQFREGGTHRTRECASVCQGPCCSASAQCSQVLKGKLRFFFLNVKLANLKMQIYILRPRLEGWHTWPASCSV